MIKERLKDLDIKITELAGYLSISRPTMYKFIDMYDAGDKKDLSNFMCELFNYIDTNELIDKKNVINYILSKVVITDDTLSDENVKLIKEIGDCINLDNNSSKKDVIRYLIKNDDLDELLKFIVDCSLSSKNKKITKKDESRIQALKRIQGIYTKEKK